MQKISLAQQKIFMFMSIGVGIVLIVLLFIYLPGQGVIGRLKDEMKGIESQIQQIESVIDQKKTIKEALQDIANQYDGLERKFPKREEDALRLMNDLARELKIEIQKRIDIYFKDTKVGIYIPDIIVNNIIILELKCKPFLSKGDIDQFWKYLRGSQYKLGFLINFSPNGLVIKRVVYDTARFKLESA